MRIYLFLLLIVSTLNVNAQSGTILPSMHAVPVAIGDMGSIKLKTSTQNVSFAQVWLSINDGAATLLYTGTNTTYNYNSIEQGSKYEFVLYSATSDNPNNITVQLDSVAVYGIPPVSIGTGFNFFAYPYYFYDITGTDPNISALNEKMVKFQLDGLKKVNCSYIRTPALGFHANNANLWLNTATRPQYWAAIDRMMQDLDDRNIKIIPSLTFDWTAIPDAFNISFTSFVNNDNTPARLAYYEYLAEFVNRYKNRPTILFWEICNEMNLFVDIYHGISTLQMNEFYKAACQVIRANDPYHMITSGNSMPRPYAYNLMMNNGWVLDSQSQAAEVLEEHDKYFDIVSIHYYPGDNERFGFNDATLVLDKVKNDVNSMKKLLFIGEFGEGTSTTEPAALFGTSVLDVIGNINIPYSAHWIWSFYQFSNYETQNFSVESSLNPALCLKFMEVNEGFGNGSATLSSPDIINPRALISWPVNNSAVSGTTAQLVNVLAMDNNLNIAKVELFVNNVKIGERASWPFQFSVPPCYFSNVGANTVKAVVYDAAGNFGEDVITLNNSHTHNGNLFKSVLTSVEGSNGWTYYRLPNTLSYVFGIEKTPSGAGANTNTFDIEVTASSLECSNINYFGRTQNKEGMFASKEFYNTRVTSNTKPNGWVNIRWFINEASISSLSSASQDFASASGANYASPLLWLKKINTQMNLIDNLRLDGIGLYYGVEQMQVHSTGIENWQNYYQFNNVTRLHGTGGAAFMRVSDITANDSIYNIPSPVPGDIRTIRFNSLTKTFEGYDGTNWIPFH